jgi:hypothetical protein
MYVIIGTTHRDGLKSILTRNSAQIGPEIGLFRGRDQASAALRGKYTVKEFEDIRCGTWGSVAPPGLALSNYDPTGPEAPGYYQLSLRDRALGRGSVAIPLIVRHRRVDESVTDEHRFCGEIRFDIIFSTSRLTEWSLGAVAGGSFDAPETPLLN